MSRRTAKKRLRKNEAPSEFIAVFVEERQERIEQALGIQIYDNLGCGAWGCVYDTDESPWVLKVTADEHEGRMWQKIWSLQKQGELLPGLPIVKRVVKLRTDHPAIRAAETASVFFGRMPEERGLEVHAIIREGFVELEQGLQEVPDLDPDEYLNILEMVEEYSIRGREFYDAQENLEHDREERVRTRLKELAWFIGNEHKIAKPFGETLAQLAELSIPPTDMRQDNLAIRLEERDGRPPSFVFLDPGVTPGGEEVSEQLVANPWHERVAGAAHIHCDVIELIPLEESSMKPNPHKPFKLLVVRGGEETILPMEFKTQEQAEEVAEEICEEDPGVAQVRVVQENGFNDNPPPALTEERREELRARRQGTPGKIRELVGEYEEEERPFDPEQPPTWRARPGELVINARVQRVQARDVKVGDYVLFREDAEPDEWERVAEISEAHPGRGIKGAGLNVWYESGTGSLWQPKQEILIVRAEDAPDLRTNARRKLTYRVRGTADRYKDRHMRFEYSSTAISMDLDDKDKALKAAKDFIESYKPEGPSARVWVEEYYPRTGDSYTIAVWTGDHMRGTWSGGMKANISSSASEEEKRHHAEKIEKAIWACDTDAIANAIQEAIKELGLVGSGEDKSDYILGLVVKYTSYKEPSARDIAVIDRFAKGYNNNPSVAEQLEERQRKAEQGDWYPAHGGTEEIFVTRTGRRLQYVYQPSTGRHAYYDADRDLILSDEEARRALGTFNENAKRCPIGTEVQTLIFPKDDFTQSQAKAWAKREGFKHGKVDTTEDTYRLRQLDPKEFRKGSFRTIDLSDRVKAVIGCPKE